MWKFMLAFMWMMMSLACADVISLKYLSATPSNGFVITPFWHVSGQQIHSVDGFQYLAILGIVASLFVCINLLLLKSSQIKSKIRVVDTKGNFIKYE